MTREQIIEACARAAFEATRAYCLSLAVTSLDSWDATPELRRERYREQVERALSGITPEKFHESWLKYMVDNGWTQGPVHDSKRKTTPCLTHYSERPRNERMKDKIFTAVVYAMHDSLHVARVEQESRKEGAL